VQQGVSKQSLLLLPSSLTLSLFYVIPLCLPLLSQIGTILHVVNSSSLTEEPLENGIRIGQRESTLLQVCILDVGLIDPDRDRTARSLIPTQAISQEAHRYHDDGLPYYQSIPKLALRFHQKPPAPAGHDGSNSRPTEPRILSISPFPPGPRPYRAIIFRT